MPLSYSATGLLTHMHREKLELPLGNDAGKCVIGSARQGETKQRQTGQALTGYTEAGNKQPERAQQAQAKLRHCSTGSPKARKEEPSSTSTESEPAPEPGAGMGTEGRPTKGTPYSPSRSLPEAAHMHKRQQEKKP